VLCIQGQSAEYSDDLFCVDRASLLNDAFSLAEAGHISYTIPLSMTEYLTKVRTTNHCITSTGLLIPVKETYGSGDLSGGLSYSRNLVQHLLML
jgi:hypothetical protein